MPQLNNYSIYHTLLLVCIPTAYSLAFSTLKFHSHDNCGAWSLTNQFSAKCVAPADQKIPKALWVCAE